MIIGANLVKDSDFMECWEYRGYSIVFRKQTDYKPFSVRDPKTGYIVCCFNNEIDAANWVDYLNCK